MNQKNTEYKLLKVRINNPITDYLESKGHHPVRDIGNKLMYLCPIHEETKPSFVVYLEGDDKEYQEYYCFGCKSHHCIVSLYSVMENVSWGEAFSFLSKDLDIEDTHVISHIIRKSQEEASRGKELGSHVLGEISLDISTMCFLHMKKVNNDLKEIKVLENFYRLIDECIHKNDIMGLIDYHNIMKNGVKRGNEFIIPLMYRYEQWKNRQDKIMKENILS